MITRVLSAAFLFGFVLAACGVQEATNVESQPLPLPTADIALVPTEAVGASPSHWVAPTQSEPATPVPQQIPTILPPTEVAAIDVQAVDEQPDRASVSMLEALLVVEINRVRAENALPPYESSPELGAAARAHSCDLAEHKLISHTSSDGRTLAERLAGANPPWEWPSESIAAGSADPKVIVAMWMDEPPEGWHRRNILDVDQRAVGVGYCYTEDDPTGNHSYWTADFSRHSGT